MSKFAFYSLFNEKILEFSKDLCESFPNIQEFKRMRAGVLFLQNIEPKTLEHMFKTYVISRYRDQLLNKDESFFIEHDEFDVQSKRTDHWKSFIDQLKQMWKTLDHDNREIIWKYFHVLIILSDKCSST